MRLHRLHLQDVKGVHDRTVTFPDTGVVVIEGPNEVGKTTLLEAFDLLLDPRAKATSQSRAVKALKPLGRDAGPRVEAEFSVGRHRLRFAKQWLRGTSTELEILSPVHEQHTGEAAQQRLDGILAESLDRPLWDALRFTQAGEMGQVALTDSAVLTEALDGASGVDLHSADGAPLLERVEEEFLRYYTRTGRVGGELKTAAAAASAARDEAVHAHQALMETQELVQHHDRLRDEMAALTARDAAVAEALDRARAHDAEVTRVVRAHEESTAALARARRDSVQAREALARRERAVQDLADAQERLDQAAESVGEHRVGLAAAQEATTGLVAARDTARAARDRASEVADLAAADVEEIDTAERVARLCAVLERLTRLRAEEATARAELTECPEVDSSTVRSLESAERSLVRFRAQLEASSPRVALVALGQPRTVVINGESLTVDGVDGSDLPVRGGLELELPGELRVTVRPEQGSAQLATDLAHAEAHLADLLEQSGVSDLADARGAAERRSATAARIRHVTERITDLLEGRSEEELTAELQQLRERTDGPGASRPVDHALPPDAATARAVARAAVAARRTADEQVELAESALRRHEQRCAQLELQIQKSLGVNETLTERLQRDRERLAEGRQEASDEALQEAVRAAGVAYAQVEARASVTGRELEEADVDGVRARLADADRERVEHEAELSRVRHALAQVQGQVEMVSGEGRQETYDLAVAEFVRLRQELDTVHRRARAARQLRETLGRHRDAAHRAYVRPYQQEIRRLGQQVYGPSFDVEVAEDLTITSRTLEGTCVPFDQLSGGAREQLGILSRLAVAGLVEEGAGVPVVIDDALGYTDPERLDRVGSVFAGPGERTQVVLLTCTPERYRGIPGATTIELTA
ncbi:AAA family ATPase [Ornithinimicrobium cavernae]|uniref:AAA family ATPase n=1 Tax=Ornithinimicrobium cavernae TaxID=2666047 RepID=UPI000D68D03A|nr:AAA family ATPase [Ornithinimicrobium cavernae]